MSFNSNAVPGLSFNGRAGFSFYDERRTWDSASNQFRNSFSKVNKFLFSEGKGLARLTSFSLNLHTSFSADGFVSDTDQQEPQAESDTVSLGERFSQRHRHEDDFDLFGSRTPGYAPVSVPWEASIDLSYNYNHRSLHNINRRLTLSTGISFELTQSWHFDVRGRYDFINKELLTPVININKDLHCWRLSLNWYPVGPNRGFYLNFSIKAPQLQDLKLEKRSSPIY
jgi:hypothetical protein